jgi:hypothetical protein
LRYRSYQQNTADGKAELVEDTTEDIPMNQGLMIEISKHAAGCCLRTPTSMAAGASQTGRFLTVVRRVRNNDSASIRIGRWRKQTRILAYE